MKKILLTILLAILSASAQYGTIDMSRYTDLLERIARDYRPHAKAYNDTAVATSYVFDFPEAAYFPYECAGLNQDTVGRTVYASPYGGVIKSRTDADGVEHIMVPTVSYVTFRDVAHVKYYEMRFYRATDGEKWSEERKPLKIKLYFGVKGEYNSCGE